MTILPGRSPEQMSDNDSEEEIRGMVRRSAMSMQWVIVISLVGVLAMGGCAKKNVAATSTGAEGRQGPSKTKVAGGPKSDATRQPRFRRPRKVR